MQPQWLSLVLVAFGVGCTPKIGDECITALDCSQLGDRLCDTTQPDGYCTMFNCEPDSCPDEAVCVAFKEVLDPSCGSVDDSRYGRFGRTFCMRTCEENDDCRGGYECAQPLARGARVVDLETDADNPQDTLVCLSATTVESAPAGQNGSCYPNEGGGTLTPYDPPAGGAPGVGGMGGFGGTAGGSGGAVVGGAAGSGGN